MARVNTYKRVCGRFVVVAAIFMANTRVSYENVCSVCTIFHTTSGTVRSGNRQNFCEPYFIRFIRSEIHSDLPFNKNANFSTPFTHFLFTCISLPTFNSAYGILLTYVRVHIYTPSMPLILIFFKYYFLVVVVGEYFVLSVSYLF